MAITFHFLTIEQFTAARTLLVEATAYLLLSIIIDHAINLFDSYRLSRGARVKLTGLTLRSALKLGVDAALVAAAVASELRTDAVLVRNAVLDDSLLRDQRLLRRAFTAARNDSDPELAFRRLDRSLAGRVGVCEWRTTFVDPVGDDVDRAVFRGEGYASAVKLANSFQIGVENGPRVLCSARRRTSVVKFHAGNSNSLRVDHGVLVVSRFIWHSHPVSPRGSDTKSVTSTLSLRTRNNQTMTSTADFICTIYMARNSSTTLTAMNLDTIITRLRDGNFSAVLCGGVLRHEAVSTTNTQNLIMLHLSAESELQTDSLSTRNFILFTTDQKLQPAEVYLASRAISPGFQSYRRRRPHGVTGAMADRLARDVVEGTFQVCGGGCDGFDVVTSSSVAARTDFVVESALIVAVILAGCATCAASVWCGALQGLSPLHRVLQTCLHDETRASVLVSESGLYISSGCVGATREPQVGKRGGDGEADDGGESGRL